MPNLIGTAPNQVPVNGLLGTMAFQDSNAVTISSGTIGGVPVSSLAASVLQGEQLDTIASSSSLVLRGGATNLLTYSEQFYNAAWTKVASSVVANTVISPNGAITGNKLVEDTTASSVHSIQQTPTLSSGIALTVSVYAKAAERNWIRLLVNANAGADGSAYFDLTTGTIGIVSGGSATITNAGNGWYRCTIAGTTTTSNPIVRINLANANGGQTYTGDGISGIYIWGAQLEAASTAGAYLKTEATAVSTAYAAPIESPNGIAVPLIASMTPARNGDMTFQLTSNTSLTIKVKGSDGTVRSVALTLA